jgi:hypothetical protein
MDPRGLETPGWKPLLDGKDSGEFREIDILGGDFIGGLRMRPKCCLLWTRQWIFVFLRRQIFCFLKIWRTWIFSGKIFGGGVTSYILSSIYGSQIIIIQYGCRFKVLPAKTVKIVCFWYVTPCSLVNTYKITRRHILEFNNINKIRFFLHRLPTCISTDTSEWAALLSYVAMLIIFHSYISRSDCWLLSYSSRQPRRWKKEQSSVDWYLNWHSANVYKSPEQTKIIPVLQLCSGTWYVAPVSCSPILKQIIWK